MRDWNMIATMAPVPEAENIVLEHLGRFGEFHRSTFKDVCLGRVPDPSLFLDAIHLASEAGEDWTNRLSRIIPIEATFQFTPDTLIDELKMATESFLERMHDGTFYVRVERRGMIGKVSSKEVEQAVADHLYELAEERGLKLHTDFSNPDFIVAAETVGDECGVALLSKELRDIYPFIHPK